MLIEQKLITAPDGSYILSWAEDSQSVADEVKARRDTDKGWVPDRGAKIMMSVPVSEFHRWEKLVGKGCWSDNDFLKFYKARRPEFVI